MNPTDASMKTLAPLLDAITPDNQTTQELDRYIAEINAHIATGRRVEWQTTALSPYRQVVRAERDGYAMRVWFADNDYAEGPHPDWSGRRWVMTWNRQSEALP